MQIKKQLTKSDFQQMYDLELQYYEDEFITPIEESYLWYKNRPHSVVAVQDQNQIVGFLCLFPILETIASDIKKGTYNDASMTYEEIIDVSNLRSDQAYTLFLSCVVIDKQYRHRNVLKLLLNEYKLYYETLTKQGIRFKEVLTDNITEEGVAFSKRLGLSQYVVSQHNSVIMSGAYEDVMAHIKS